MNMRRAAFAAACYASCRSQACSGLLCADTTSAPSARERAVAWIDRRSIVSKHVIPAERQHPLQLSAARQEAGRDECGTVRSDHAGCPPYEGPSFSLSKVCSAWSTPTLPRIRKGGPTALSARPARGFLQIFVAGVLLLALSSTGASLPAQPMPGSTQASRQTADPLLAGFSRWDADFDGVLTCQEWKRYAEQLFIRSDRNGNGVLEPEEFATLGKYEPIFSKADLAYFDDNLDGRISLREFADKPNPIFARYDRNRDCQLTADEIRGGPASGTPPSSPSNSQQKPPSDASQRRSGAQAPSSN